jgi:hypothetical protein
MRSPKPRVSPAMVVAITALVFATTGVGYAASQLGTGSHAHAAKKKVKRGPAGPQGPKGDTGAPGAAGSPGAITFTGRINSLNTNVNSDAFATPSGASTADPSLTSVYTASPNVDLTAKSLTVVVDNPPGGTSLRFFYLTVGLTDSGGCVITSGSGSCTIPLNLPIPAISSLAIHSSVAVSNAVPTNAEFAWTAQ